ncbi:MAG: glycosyltransferase family 1 protein [Rhodospirillales bacterium]|nr:glycosyltransferase family 1 protein [Rhodospirillales bacterium]
MRLLIVSDAWFPQVNGVVRTLDTLRKTLIADGHTVAILAPDQFRTLPCPSYPEIRLALATAGAVGRRIAAFQPAAIHIATEGPLGTRARRWCLRHGHPFTTSLHTRFPEYLYARWRVPMRWTYAWMRRFHSAALRTMVATSSLEDDLKARGFPNLVRWSRGVDTTLFRPRDKGFIDAPRPVSLYVGRVAVEKSIEDFLKLDLPGTKVVVGDGPQLPMLRARYPAVRFVGMKQGEELACYYAAADVFVFPSRTDTFGLVLLEALASGVPVAAYPVPGPLDVLGTSGAGVLADDLGAAVCAALAIPAERCRKHAERYAWSTSAQQFVSNLGVRPDESDANSGTGPTCTAPAPERRCRRLVRAEAR